MSDQSGATPSDANSPREVAATVSGGRGGGAVAAADDPNGNASTKQQVRELVELLGRHIETERSDSQRRAEKFRTWEQQQALIIQTIEQRPPQQQGSPPQPTSMAVAEPSDYDDSRYRHHHSSGVVVPSGREGSNELPEPTQRSAYSTTARSASMLVPHVAPPQDTTAATNASTAGATVRVPPLALAQQQQSAPSPAVPAASTTGGQQQQERAIEALNHKCEHLARTLVKALRENKVYAETVSQLTREVTALHERVAEAQELKTSNAQQAAELHSTREILRERDEEVQRARAEARQRTAVLEKQVVSEREVRHRVAAEKEALMTQVSQQLADLVSEHEAVLDLNEEYYMACERAGTDLKLAIRRGRDFEQRALAAEKALLDERAARVAAEQLAEEAAAGGAAALLAPPGANDTSTAAGGGGDGATTDGGGAADATTQPVVAQNSSSAAAVRTLHQRIARLEARARADAHNHEDELRRMQRLIEDANAAREDAERRVSDLETGTRSLKRQLAQAVRESTNLGLGAQAARDRLKAIRRDAHDVTSVMSVTRSDAEHIATRVQDDAEVAMFVTRATSDLTHLANFLSLLRSLDTEPPPVAGAAAADAARSATAASDNTHTPVRGYSSAGGGGGGARRAAPLLAPIDDDDDDGQGGDDGVVNSSAATPQPAVAGAAGNNARRGRFVAPDPHSPNAANATAPGDAQPTTTDRSFADTIALLDTLRDRRRQQ